MNTMLKNNFLFLNFVTLVIYFFLGSNGYSKRKIEALACINETVVTEYDVSNFMKIIKTNDREKALKEYVELIQHYKIASKNGVGFSRKDKIEDYWSQFSVKFKTDKTKSEFCKSNKIDEKFLDNYIKMFIVWERYFEGFIARSIDIKRDTVLENIEVTGKANSEISYELSEIVLDYSNSKQKKEAKAKIDNLFKNKNFDKNLFNETAKSISNSKSAENGGYIGWTNESDFSIKIANIIKNTDIGSLTKPICIGDIKGFCFIFVVHDSKATVNIDQKDEIRAFNDFYKKTIDIRTAEIVSSYDDIVNIKYNKSLIHGKFFN